MSLTNPQAFYRNIQISNIHDIFLSRDHSIGGISRALNDPDHLIIRALLNIMLGDIILFLNVGKTMTKGQLIETVSLTVKHYHHFKPADFKYCLEEVKKGSHGPLYDRIDGQVILSWFKAYDQERDYAAAEINSNKNEVYKMVSNRPLLPVSGNAPGDYDEVFKSNLLKLQQNLAANKAEREAEKQKQQQIERTKDPISEMHNRWMNQFDALLIKQRKENNQLGFVRKYGLIKNNRYQPGKPSCGPKMILRYLNINEYLYYKQWQYQLALLSADKRQIFYLTKYPKK